MELALLSRWPGYHRSSGTLPCRSSARNLLLAAGVYTQAHAPSCRKHPWPVICQMVHQRICNEHGTRSTRMKLASLLQHRRIWGFHLLALTSKGRAKGLLFNHNTIADITS